MKFSDGSCCPCTGPDHSPICLYHVRTEVIDSVVMEESAPWHTLPCPHCSSVNTHSINQKWAFCLNCINHWDKEAERN